MSSATDEFPKTWRLQPSLLLEISRRVPRHPSISSRWLSEDRDTSSLGSTSGSDGPRACMSLFFAQAQVRAGLPALFKDQGSAELDIGCSPGSLGRGWRLTFGHDARHRAEYELSTGAGSLIFPRKMRGKDAVTAGHARRGGSSPLVMVAHSTRNRIVKWCR